MFSDPISMIIRFFCYWFDLFCTLVIGVALNAALYLVVLLAETNISLYKKFVCCLPTYL